MILINESSRFKHSASYRSLFKNQFDNKSRSGIRSLTKTRKRKRRRKRKRKRKLKKKKKES